MNIPPSARPTTSRGRSSASPSIRAKLGVIVRRMSPAAPASGAVTARAIKTIDLAQPSIPKLSFCMFSIAQPTKIPAKSAIVATPNQELNEGSLTRRSRAAAAIPKVAAARTNPPAACSGQYG
jgi:hypothetical protein